MWIPLCWIFVGSKEFLEADWHVGTSCLCSQLCSVEYSFAQLCSRGIHKCINLCPEGIFQVLGYYSLASHAQICALVVRSDLRSERLTQWEKLFGSTLLLQMLLLALPLPLQCKCNSCIEACFLQMCSHLFLRSWTEIIVFFESTHKIFSPTSLSRRVSRLIFRKIRSPPTIAISPY